MALQSAKGALVAAKAVIYIENHTLQVYMNVWLECMLSFWYLLEVKFSNQVLV